MFDFEKQMKETETKKEAERMLAKMLSKIMLDSDAPEEVKMSIRLMASAQSLLDTVHEVLSLETLNSKKINIGNAQKFCFFLKTMEEQIKAFAINNPLITNTEANDENI